MVKYGYYKTWPLSWIEDLDISKFTGECINISTRSTKTVCLELGKGVEKMISKEIHGAVGEAVEGAILHDG